MASHQQLLYHIVFSTNERTFQDEYLKMLVDHEVEYDPKYLWE